MKQQQRHPFFQPPALGAPPTHVLEGASQCRSTRFPRLPSHPFVTVRTCPTAAVRTASNGFCRCPRNHPPASAPPSSAVGFGAPMQTCIRREAAGGGGPEPKSLWTRKGPDQVSLRCISSSPTMRSGPRGRGCEGGPGGPQVPRGSVRRGLWGSGAQKFVYQKWPDQIFPMATFVSHDGPFGLGGGGGASLEGEGGRSGHFQSGCRAVTGDVKAWAVTGGWKCGWGWCWGMGMPLG